MHSRQKLLFYFAFNAWSWDYFLMLLLNYRYTNQSSIELLFCIDCIHDQNQVREIFLHFIFNNQRMEIFLIIKV